jgi:hypothetical protein
MATSMARLFAKKSVVLRSYDMKKRLQFPALWKIHKRFEGFRAIPH